MNIKINSKNIKFINNNNIKKAINKIKIQIKFKEKNFIMKKIRKYITESQTKCSIKNIFSTFNII